MTKKLSKEQKSSGRRQVYFLLFTTLVILISVHFYNQNKQRRLTNEIKQPVLSHIETVQAQAEPVVVPEPTPEPVVQPAPPVVVPVVHTGDCSLVNNYTDWDTRVAYAICMAESGGRVTAHNANDNHGKCVGSYSLMQVGCFWYPYYGYSSADFYNPQVNVEIAHNIWKRQGGFVAWTTYTRGTYQKYL